MCVFVYAHLGILQKPFDVFLSGFDVFFSGFVIRVRGGVRARDGVGDGFRVRDRVSVRAKGGLDFIYYRPNLLE